MSVMSNVLHLFGYPQVDPNDVEQCARLKVQKLLGWADLSDTVKSQAKARAARWVTQGLPQETAVARAVAWARGAIHPQEAA